MNWKLTKGSIIFTIILTIILFFASFFFVELLMVSFRDKSIIDAPRTSGFPFTYLISGGMTPDGGLHEIHWAGFVGDVVVWFFISLIISYILAVLIFRKRTRENNRQSKINN